MTQMDKYEKMDKKHRPDNCTDKDLLTKKMISKEIGFTGLSTFFLLMFMGIIGAFASEDDRLKWFWVISVILLLGICSMFFNRWMWKAGKFRLVKRQIVRKESVDSDGTDICWLFFSNPGDKELKLEVADSIYENAKFGDRYYLVLKKKITGRDKILLYYKADRTTLDDELKALLQK